MHDRLGNVIYWVGCIIGAGLVLLGLSGILSGEYILAPFVVGAGFICWHMGSAAERVVRKIVPYRERWGNGKLNTKGAYV
jgi:hypothetical protein